MKTIKIYIIVFMVTVVHGIIALLFLRGIPYISLRYVDKYIICSAAIWYILTTSFCYIVNRYVVFTKNKIRLYILPALFGIFATALKAVLDFLQSELGYLFERIIVTTILDEITIFVFGIIMMCFLFLVIGKQRMRSDWKKVAKVPIIIVATLVGIYTCVWFYYLHDFYSVIERFNATEQQVINLDYYYLIKISKVNVPFYVMFYPLFWWMLSSCTRRKGDE